MRRLRASLGAKLFISYLFVVLVGVLTLFLAVSTFGPPFFQTSTQQMMGTSGMNGMMGQPITSGTQNSATLDASFRQALTQALLLATLLATLAALLASLLVTRQLIRPIDRMLAAVKRIGAGHYAERVAVKAANASDALGQLAASVNDMAASLEQTERRRVELVGDVAHELRTPIATLEGYLEGLLDGVIEPGERTWATLHDETGRLRRLVDDLQELSRAEARQIHLEMRAIAPSDIVEAAITRLAPQFTEKRLRFDVCVRQDTPSVRADRDRAVQVLTNLLTNALRYTPAPGSVEVTVTRAGAMVAFQVRDSGAGLAPEQVARVFERFYRVEKSRSRALGGSGIGLSIARALVDAMGGQISAESAGLRKGSTFTFTLPTAR